MCGKGISTLCATTGVVLILGLLAPVFGSTTTARKRSKSDHDLSAIGHRRIDRSGPNWYSLSTEQQVGEKLAGDFDKAVVSLDDPATTAYLQRLTQKVVQNSDSQFPVTVRVIDTPEVYAVTLPGGFQYMSRGLVTQVNSECELAAVIARGIAHTGLRSAARQSTRASLLKVTTIPLIFVGSAGISNARDVGFAVPLTLLKFGRDDELDADYFGVQYLYKSGYDPQCFVRLLQISWPEPLNRQRSLSAFSAFPPLAERVRAIDKEIASILPKRAGEVTDTQEFSEWRQHLRALPPPKMVAKPFPILLPAAPVQK